MRLKLLPKFIASLGVLGLVLTVSISLFSYGTSKTYLENMYAERVMINSDAIASMLNVEDVKKVIAEGGDATAEYSQMVNLFNELKQDGDVTFLSLVVPDEDSVRFYIDAMVEEMGDDPANQIPYGSDILYVDAANPDDPADMEKYISIWEQYSLNQGITEPLVTDNAYGYNKSGDSAGAPAAHRPEVLRLRDELMKQLLCPTHFDDFCCIFANKIYHFVIFYYAYMFTTHTNYGKMYFAPMFSLFFTAYDTAAAREYASTSCSEVVK